MSTKSPGEKVLSNQDATVTITESKVVISCNDREDADKVFQFICSLCDIAKDAT